MSANDELIAELDEEITVEKGEARAEERAPSSIVHLLGRARDALSESDAEVTRLVLVRHGHTAHLGAQTLVRS